MKRKLETYLVGGAVRDELLGLPGVDKDWVVVGSSVQEMLDQGFTQVGRDFPVFLHPQTHEEYALARTERKQGQGHRGFVVNAAADVTLEEDLLRRDLTINAIAKDHDGVLIDPCGGVTDLRDRVLRHVSPAFSEDPLRVFRVARFSAQLSNFVVAPETLQLMRKMCEAGELELLSAERIWAETEKALAANDPQRFFATLDEVSGLDFWMPELRGSKLGFERHDAVSRFAELPLNEQQLEQLSIRLKVPGRFSQAALDVLLWASMLGQWRDIEISSLAAAMQALQASHNNVRIAWLAQWLFMAADEQAALVQLCDGWRSVQIADTDLSGRAYGTALYKARCGYLDQARRR